MINKIYKKAAFLLLLSALPQLAGVLSAQTSVATAGKKYVLVEEGTGAWCQYCPDGAVILEDVLKRIPRSIVVSVHWKDAMETADGTAMVAQYFGSFPSGAVDRVSVNGAVGLHPTEWGMRTAARSNTSSKADVQMDHSYNPATRTISVTVTAKTLVALSGKYNLNVYVTEDNCTGTGTGWDQVNAYDNQNGHPYKGAGNPIVGFKHMHVLRAMLGGTWGTSGVVADDPAANQSFSKTYTYTIPAGYNENNMKLVAMMQKFGATPDDREILNSIQAKLVTPTGINEMQFVSDIHVYPVPATDALYIDASMSKEGTVRIAVVDLKGATIFEKYVKAGTGRFSEQIPVNGWASGPYMLLLSDESGRTSRMITVQ